MYLRFNNARDGKYYFIITDRSIIERRVVRGVIKEAEYPYSALDPIELVNVPHPNLPADKRLEVFFDILKTAPYNADYQEYMLKQWGENDQTNAIKSYSGFTDFTNRRELF